MEAIKSDVDTTVDNSKTRGWWQYITRVIDGQTNGFIVSKYVSFGLLASFSLVTLSLYVGRVQKVELDCIMRENTDKTQRKSKLRHNFSSIVKYDILTFCFTCAMDMVIVRDHYQRLGKREKEGTKANFFQSSFGPPRFVYQKAKRNLRFFVQNPKMN